MRRIQTRRLSLQFAEGSSRFQRLGFPDLPEVNAAIAPADAPEPAVMDPADGAPGYLLGDLRIAVARDGETVDLGARSPGRTEPIDNGARMTWDPPAILAESSARADGEDIVWEIAVANAGRGEAELRRLALPLAFNNWYHGYGTDDAGLERLYQHTFYIHRRMAGDGSAVYVQRLRGEGPDIVLLPEPGTDFRATHFARWSIARYTSLVQWEGVPLLYLVAADLEEVVHPDRDPVAGPRDPLILPPGESLRFALRFRRVDDGRFLDAALAAHDVPAPAIVPGLVIPRDLPLRIRTGADPGGRDRVDTDPAREPAPDPLAPDAPHARIFAFDRPGDVRVRVTRPDGRCADLRARVIDPIEELMRRRAAFICERQICRAPGTPLDGGIFPWNDADGSLHTAHDDYWGPGCYEGAVCDALFLAEKNALLPDRDEIAVLERYAREFLWGRLQNPANHDVAWYFATPEGGALKTGRCYNYSHVINFYHALYTVGARYGFTNEDPLLYLRRAAGTAVRMFEIGWRYHLWASGMMGMSRVYEVLDDIRIEGLAEPANTIQNSLDDRAERLLALRFPYASECEYDTTSYEDVYFTARRYNDFEQMRRIVSCILAARHLSTTWFWSASDKRWWDAAEVRPAYRWVGDRGENCLHYTTASNSLVLLADLEEEQFIHDPRLPAAGYGGLIAPWSLVREDGFAAMCYCPDPASDHAGFNEFTGDIGLNLYCTLRGLKSYVVHPRSGPPEPYGCDLRMPDPHTCEVIPRDGVRREVFFTSPRMRVMTDAACIERVVADRRQRRFEVEISNPSPAEISAVVIVEGLWGEGFVWTVDGAPASGEQDGDAALIAVDLPGGADARLTCAPAQES